MERNDQVFDSLIAVYAQTKIDEAKKLVKEISDDIKQFNTDLEDLEGMLNDTTKKVTKQHLLGIMVIQNRLEENVRKVSNGDSLLWEHPELAAQPLLILSSFISTFSRIRDLFFENAMDLSIISCQMEESLNAYFPLILYWRLRHVESTNENAKVHDEVIYDITYMPEMFDENYKWTRNNRTIRCESNCHRQSLDNDDFMFKDSLQADKRTFCQRQSELEERDEIDSYKAAYA